MLYKGYNKFKYKYKKQCLTHKKYINTIQKAKMLNMNFVILLLILMYMKVIDFTFIYEFIKTFIC